MMKNTRRQTAQARRRHQEMLPAKLRARPVKVKTWTADPTVWAGEEMPVIASGGFFRRWFGGARKPTADARPGARPAPSKGKSKGRVLWIGDAVVPTGFAKVTHSLLAHLCRDWEVVVSGVNYDGAPHEHPYTIMPAWQGGDMWGMDRFADVCAEFAPDAVIINNDWWNVAGFLEVAPRDLPIVAYMPVDGQNLNPVILPQLDKLAAAVWYTDFGHQEAVKAGFTGFRHVIPHGLDARQYRPVEKGLARRLLELPVDDGAFIVGNVNRNQPRKRLDLTLQYFAEWVRRHQVENARLLLHCAKKDTGWDLESLARYHGIADRLLFTGGDHLRGSMGNSMMQLVYSSLDVQVSTTLGEGWGLTTMEGMACGVPQIVPDWAALREWSGPARKVPCSTLLVHPEINTVGALADKEPFIAELQSLYDHPGRRQNLGRQGMTFVRQKQFQWSTVARQMDEVLSSVLTARPQRQRTAQVSTTRAAG